jgi:L-lactate dehydrogenase complex protein LldE
MTVTLFIPCFMDALFPRAGISMVEILERLGHKVVCPNEIACCGQPPFNSGYWDEARTIAAPALEKLKDAEAVVIGSGSCGAMLKKFYPELFKNTPQAELAKQVASRTWEFSDFLVSKLGEVDGLEFFEMKEESCCGFGGTFSAKFPMISTAMGEVKCAAATETGADFIVSNDSSCLMHIQGLLSRQGSKIKTIHLAEVLNQK